MIVVQVVTTRWTKASRGAPGANERAQVPDCVVLPPLDLGDPVAVVHQLEASESDDFAVSQTEWEAVDVPFVVAGVAIRHADGGVEVERMAGVDDGWPPREHRRTAFRLHPGEWGRAIRNSRHSGWRDWSYMKIVVNVGNFNGFDRDVFTVGTPTYVLDEQTKLR